MSTCPRGLCDGSGTRRVCAEPMAGMGGFESEACPCGAVDTPAVSGLYYLIQYQQFNGDSVIWWRPNSSGYTIRIDEAGRYPEAEARRIEAIRGLDKAVPVEVAEAAASRHVVADDLYKARDAAGFTGLP